MDKYLILRNFCKFLEKEIGEAALCNWARRATVQQAQRERGHAGRRARARFLNLTGGAQLSVGEREDEGEVRMTGGAHLS